MFSIDGLNARGRTNQSTKTELCLRALKGVAFQEASLRATLRKNEHVTVARLRNNHTIMCRPPCSLPQGFQVGAARPAVHIFALSSKLALLRVLRSGGA